MKTITVQIGNSDGKLTQQKWSEFVRLMNSAIFAYATEIHFFGGSANWETWQNVCWVFNCEDTRIDALKYDVTQVRTTFLQDSVAWTEGVTAFI